MAKAEASVEELVSMIERGELRLPEMQRQYVWRSTRVRDLLDSLYRGYPSGAILLWETDEAVPLQDFAVSQSTNPYQSTRLLLDGQQRLTSLSAVIRGEPASVVSTIRVTRSTASAWPGYAASASMFIGWMYWNGRFPTTRSRKSSSG